MSTRAVRDARGAALEGSLEALALSDVLQLLDVVRKTGALFLRVASPPGWGVVVLVDGRVYGAAASIGDGAGATRQMMLAAALSADPAATESAAYELLRCGSGAFVFVAMNERAEAACRRAASAADRTLGVDALLMRAAARSDEWARLAPHVPDARAVPALADSEDVGSECRSGDAPLSLAPDDWALLAEVDGTRDVRALARDLRRDPLAVARSAVTLAGAGLIIIERPDVARDASRSS